MAIMPAAGQANPSDEGSPPAVGAAPIATSAAFRLGPGDRLRITTYGERDLSGEFTVAADGLLSFPLIGNVHAGGGTVEQLQEAITAALASGYIRNPRVSAEILTYRPFYILGEVNKPGEYPYSTDLTVFNAVATAQGFTYRANTRIVFIRHAGNDKEDKARLASDTKVQPGDTIRISERFF